MGLNGWSVEKKRVGLMDLGGGGGSPGLLREKRAGLNKGVVCWEKRVDFIIRGWSVGKKRVGFIIRGWSVGRRGWVL